jgi:hypothetical protein
MSIEVEHRIAERTTLSISLLKRRTYKMYSVNDVNLPTPTVSKTYAIDNAAGVQTSTYATLIQTTKNDGKYAHIWNVQNGGSAWYEAGVAELRRNMAHDMTALVSYTWSHNITDGIAPTIFGFLPLNLTNGNISVERADSPIDQRHRVTGNLVWQPHQKYLKGFTVSALGMYGSGQPLNATVIVAGQQFSGNTMIYPTTLNGWGGWNRVPFQPLNNLRIGSEYNMDARISRAFTFRDRVSLTVMFEAFNALNTQYDTAINTVAFQAIPTAPPAGAVSGPTTGVLHPVNGLGAGIAGSPARTAQVAVRLTF